MVDHIAWGILGTARINHRLIPPIQASSRSRLIAVASRDLSRAQTYAAERSIPTAYGSYEELLADPRIDAVYISLPNSLHAGWTVRAAQAGKHVLCEKPLAITLDEVDAISEAATRAGVVVQEAFMYRHHPQTIKVQELVASGTLGKVWLVHGTFSFPIENTTDVRLDPALGGGSLWDVGCYPLSYARTVLKSEPLELTGWQRTGPTGIDLSFAGQLSFPGEAVAQIDCSFASPRRTFMEIVGDRASLEIHDPFIPMEKTAFTLRFLDHLEQVEIPASNPYACEVENMVDAILDGASPRITLADSRANVAAILGLLESAKEKEINREARTPSRCSSGKDR